MAVTIDRDQTRPEGGLAYDGLRGWLEQLERMGQLRLVHGANAEAEIGAATDVLQHVDGGPGVMFDQVPGYDPSFRVFVNGFGAIDRIALTLGLPLGRSKIEVSDAWRRKIKELRPIPPV